MSGYGKICMLRTLDVIVYDENNNDLSGGIKKVEELPQELKERTYKKIEVGNPTKLYL